MLRFSLCLTFLLSGPALANTDLPKPLRSLLAERVADCEGLDNGQLQLEDGAIQSKDLTGDGEKDWVLDEYHLRCSSAASMYCGTGGCNVNFLVGDVVTSRLAKGWDTTTLGGIPVVLVQIHGANCDGTNMNPCVEAMVWDATEQRFFSLAAQP